MSVIFFFVVTLSAISAYFVTLNNKKYSTPIAHCILGLSDITRYSKTTLVLYEADNENLEFNEELISLIVDKQLSYIVTNNLTDLYTTHRNYTDDILVVMYHKSCNTLDIPIKKATKYLVVVDEHIFDSQCYDNFVKNLLKVRTYDVTFITKDKMYDKYNFITGKLYWNENNCDLDGKVTIKNLNTCVNGSLEKYDENTIFPPKHLKNLKMCTFKVGMAALFPYSIIENDDSFKNLHPLKEKDIFGSDLEIIKIMAKKFNATLEMFYIKRDEKYDYIKYLLNGSLDACAGGLYNIYGDVVAYSGIYTRQSVIWIYTVERETRSWQALMRKTGGLYIFLIFLASYSITWKLFCQFDGRAVSLSNTILHSFGALVGTTSLLDAMSLKQKILNISYLILCLHLSFYINTQIYYHLTVQNPPQTINTQDELAVSDRKLYLNSTEKYFLNDNKYLELVNTSYDCGDFLDCERSVLRHRGATLILDGLLPSFQSLTAVDGESKIMRVDQDVLVLYHEMIMRKDSLLVYDFHNIILRLFEAGICDKLYKEAIGVTIADKATIAVKNTLSNSYKCYSGCKITWSQLAGFFYLWMIGCGLSICCFVIELLLKQNIYRNLINMI